MPDPDSTTDPVQASASRRRCSTTRADGGRCRAWASAGTSRCWAHRDDPEGRAAARDRRAAGGRARSADAQAAKALLALGDEISIADTARLLRGALVAVVDGSLGPGTAMALATLSRAAASADEAAAIARRLDDVERLLAAIAGPQDGR